MSPPGDAEFTWENTSARNRQIRILATGFPPARENTVTLSSSEAACLLGKMFGALSFGRTCLCLNFFYSSA